MATDNLETRETIYRAKLQQMPVAKSSDNPNESKESNNITEKSKQKSFKSLPNTASNKKFRSIKIQSHPSRPSNTESIIVEDIERSPGLWQLFGEYCDDESSKENYDFYVATRRILSLINNSIPKDNAKEDTEPKVNAEEDTEEEQEVQVNFKKIFDKFLAQNSASQISLSHQLQQEISQENQRYEDSLHTRNIKAGFTAKQFRIILACVKHNLETDTIQRFIKLPTIEKHFIVLSLLKKLDIYLETNNKDKEAASPSWCGSCWKLDLCSIYNNLEQLRTGLLTDYQTMDIDINAVILKIGESLTKHQELLGEKSSLKSKQSKKTSPVPKNDFSMLLLAALTQLEKIQGEQEKKDLVVNITKSAETVFKENKTVIETFQTPADHEGLTVATPTVNSNRTVMYSDTAKMVVRSQTVSPSSSVSQTSPTNRAVVQLII